jgi:hypothetical protein
MRCGLRWNPPRTDISEVRRDRLIAAVRILLLRLLGVLALSVPGRTAPGVAGEGAFHAEQVICVLRQFRFAVAGFEDELRHRNRCEDARFLLVSRKQYPTLFTTSASESPEKAEACVPCVVVGPSVLSVPLPRAAVTFEARSPILAYIQLPGQAFVCKPAMDGQHHLIGFGCSSASYPYRRTRAACSCRCACRCPRTA